MAYFVSSSEHLLAELERIDLFIRLRVSWERRSHEADEAFQGLYISEEEVDALLARPAGMPGWAAEAGPLAARGVREALAELEDGIAERKAEAGRRGIVLRLSELKRLFGLSSFEIDALLVCLAPELDSRYERLFAYLQDDVTRRRPSVDLVLNLLSRDFEAKLAARRIFGPDGALLRHLLLETFEDPSRPHPPLVARYVKADERVAAYLLGEDAPDARLAAYSRLIEPAARLDDLVLDGDLKRRLGALARTPTEGNAIVYLQGPYGVGKTTVAEAVCRARGLKLLATDLGALADADDATFATVLALAAREARLQPAAVCWRGLDRLLEDGREARRARFLDRLEAGRGLSFLAGEATWEPSGALRGADFLRFELPLPGHRERDELWSRLLAAEPGGAAEGAGELAVKFRLSGGQIRDAAATARSLARRRSPENGLVTAADLLAACKLHSNRKLSGLAQKIVPRHRWDDIVLPRDRLEQLREIANTARFRARVYEDWGFGRKLTLGKGLAVLFAGPSGTGKTMAAEILAGELGLDLYRIDLSAVISKYIGETEKNLSRIFAEAETSNAILFFDEADALFGKRSEVRDAHDRYANVEISYLLQRMEQYEGTAILASNLKKNMDEAFVRRLKFTVDFPLPRESDRRRIWEGIWAVETPRSPELDFGFMARRFEVAGGHIKNIALAAAFLAAADGGVVEMSHLLHATRREFQKMGKIVTREDFRLHVNRGEP